MMNRRDGRSGGKRFDLVERIADPDRNRRIRVFRQMHRHRNKIWGPALVTLLHEHESNEIPTFISHFLNATDCLSTIAECEKEKGGQIPSALSIDTAIMIFASEAGRRFARPHMDKS